MQLPRRKLEISFPVEIYLPKKKKVALLVSGRVTKDPKDIAFDLAQREGPKDALKIMKSELKKYLKPNEYRMIKGNKTAKFSEFDSGNISHAGAYYQWGIKAPQEVIDKLGHMQEKRWNTCLVEEDGN